MYSKRDIYPNFHSVLSTSENTIPEVAESSLYTRGEDQGVLKLVTQKDRTNVLLGILVLVGVLFLFGVIK